MNTQEMGLIVGEYLSSKADINIPRYDDFYLAILEVDRRYKSFFALDSARFFDFETFLAGRGIKIVAEKFYVSKSIMGDISKFLSRLTGRLDRGEKLNAQEELEELCVS